MVFNDMKHRHLARWLTVLLVTAVSGCGRGGGGDDTTISAALTGSATFAIPLPPKVGISTIAAGANDALLIDDRASVRTATGAPGAVANMGNHQTNLGVTAHVADVWSVGPVTLRDRAVVTGSVRTQSSLTRGSNTVVTGAVVTNTLLTPPDLVTWTVTFPPASGGNVILQPSQTRVLAPGSYGMVSIAARAKVTLSAGTYFFQSFDLEPTATLSLNDSVGPIAIYVANSIIFRGVASDTRNDASNILVGFAGTAAVAIEAPFDGTLVAPNASVTVGSMSHQGAFFAKHLELYPDAVLVQRTFPALPPGICTGVADGTSCSDQNLCTTGDRCKGGVCTGTAVVCGGTDTCHQSFCDPSTGTCLVAAADGRKCDDGNPATLNDICVAGVCAPKEETTPKCGTMTAYENELRANPRFAASRVAAEQSVRLQTERIMADPTSNERTGVIVIPVVVHVVHNTDAQNIPDSQIQSQIDVLNRDYRRLNTDASGVPGEFSGVAGDPRIQFQLAARDPNCAATNGITRTTTATTAFDGFNSDAVKSAATGGADPWPANQYLNFWVAPLLTGQLGRGTFPGEPAATDGVIIEVTAFGTTGNLQSAFNLGRTATHEVGHYFNLYHTFQGGCSGTTASTCLGAGDLVCDTPAEFAKTLGCPGTVNTCTDSPTDLDDPTMAYMDYTDDRCMFMFTDGQIVRMEATLAGPRASLAASAGAIAPPASSTGPWSADTPDDLGNEPNTISQAFYVSDDIWVRNQDDGIMTQEHQDPIFRASGPANHVFVLVRNRTCGTVENANLKLYWAKASSALAWPSPWDGTVTSPALMGQPIATQGTGVLPVGGSTILDFSWSPPNPADYGSFGGDATHFCLLSRIETSATSPFGMTFPETADLNGNVQNNSKIVWKNVSVASDAGNRTAAVTVGPAPNGGPVRLTFDEPQNPKPSISVFDWGAVQVDLGASLFAKWLAGGSVGSLITAVPGTTKVNLLGSGAFVGNISLVAGDLSTISVAFFPNASSELSPRELPDVYYLDLTETSSAGVVGGQRFTLKTFAPAVFGSEPPG